MTKRGDWLRCAAAAALAASAMIVGAQAAPAQTGAPGSAPTGVPTREELERLAPPPKIGAPVRLSVSGEIERAPCPLADPQYADVRFTPRSVQFSGLKGIGAEELRPSYAAYIGREAPIALVCEIRDRAATILRHKGYLAAVQVPPQRIADGNVRFDVLMARLKAIQVRGSAGRSERIVAATLEPLTRREVFNQFEAERALLLARDIPGADVRLTLRPAGETPGEVVASIAIDFQPVEADATIQNYGSHDVGRWSGLARVQLNGLTGFGDRTVLGIFSTADFGEQWLVRAGHDFALGGSGLRLGLRATRAWTEPDIEGVDLKARTTFATLDATYPLLRSQARNLIGAVGLDFVNQRVRIEGEPLSRDRLRVAFARLDWLAVDRASIDNFATFSAAMPRWTAGGSIELRRGLDILDASQGCGADLTCLATSGTPPTRTEGDPTATVIRGRLQGEWRPVPAFFLSLEPSFQYSRQPLFAFEEYSGGNYTVGRGYDPGAITGDSAIGLRAEAGYDLALRHQNQLVMLRPYGFLDSAWMWNRDRLTVEDEPLKLASVGGGLRASLSQKLRLDATLAVPLRRVGIDNERPGTRFLISLSSRFIPWNGR